MNISKEESNKRILLNNTLTNSIRQASKLWFHKWVTTRQGDRHKIEYDTGITIRYANDGKPIELLQWYNKLPVGNDDMDLFNEGDIIKKQFPIEMIGDKLFSKFQTRNNGEEPVSIDLDWFTYYNTINTNIDDNINNYDLYNTLTTPEETQQISFDNVDKQKPGLKRGGRSKKQKRRQRKTRRII